MIVHKAGKTEFKVYHHCLHGFSNFSDAIQYFEPHPLIALISGHGLGNLTLKHQAVQLALLV